MTEVNECHEIATVTDDGRGAFTSGPMNCDVLADVVVIADGQKGRLALELAILGIAPDDRALSKIVAVTDGGSCLDRYMGVQSTFGADLHASFDIAKWAHLDILGEFRFRMDE